MMRALIVDDEEPARAKLRRWLGRQSDVEVVGECADALAATRSLEAVPADVLFLDVQMPGLSGLDWAAQLEATTAPVLVFVTAHDAHALAAFDLDAVDYLLKPYDEERFERALLRVRERLDSPRDRAAPVRAARRASTSGARLLVEADGELRLLAAAAIHVIEADDNYVHVCTTDHRYMLRRTLRDLLVQLGEDAFMRIHKSAAVNLTQIEAISSLCKGDYELRLKSGRRMRLSRRFAPRFFARIDT